MDFKIIEINTDLDHIHLLISCKPQHYRPTIVKSLKGTSARLLFKLDPELKKRILWWTFMESFLFYCYCS